MPVPSCHTPEPSTVDHDAMNHAAMGHDGMDHSATSHEGMADHSAMGHHTMEGLPLTALYGTMVAALLVTLWGLTRGRHWFRHTWSPRFQLNSLRPIAWLLKQRWFQFSLQLPLVLILGLLIYAGFYGTPVSDENIATVLTWSIWWTLLILDILLLGRMWCLACPWEALAAWTRRLALWRRNDEPLALNYRWPKWLQNVYPATILFTGLTWLELGHGVSMKPAATAMLGLLMVIMAVIPAMFFERRAFCKYGCLIGRVVGIYSMIAPVEVRAKDKSVCRSCKTKDCYRGNEKGYPCPTGQYLPTMQHNTYCTVCTECFKTCPSDNVALNLRPFCSDLETVRKPRRDEAIFAIVLVALTSFHGLTMTPTWNALLSDTMFATGLPRLTSFSLMMAAFLALPFVIFYAGARLATRLGAWTKRSVLGPRPIWRVAAAYAYPMIAIALMYHLAHNAGHFLMEGTMVVPVLSDPLGNGADYFGTADFQTRMLGSMTTVWVLMIFFVLVGHIWATRAMERAHRGLARSQSRDRLPWKARVAIGIFPLLVTGANLWLLAQPMEMRTGM